MGSQFLKNCPKTLFFIAKMSLTEFCSGSTRSSGSSGSTGNATSGPEPTLGSPRRGPTWGVLGWSWVGLGAILGVLEASWGVLWLSWGVLEPSCGVLEQSWSRLGASWGGHGVVVGRSWGHLGGSWGVLGQLVLSVQCGLHFSGKKSRCIVFLQSSAPGGNSEPDPLLSTTFHRIHRKRNQPVQNRPWVPRAGGQDYGSLLHTNSLKLY